MLLEIFAYPSKSIVFYESELNVYNRVFSDRV